MPSGWSSRFSLGDSILDQPLIGRVVPEMGQAGIRERFVYSWRVIYRIGKDGIEVLAVVHGHRLLASMVNRFED